MKQGRKNIKSVIGKARKRRIDDVINNATRGTKKKSGSKKKY